MALTWKLESHEEGRWNTEAWFHLHDLTGAVSYAKALRQWYRTIPCRVVIDGTDDE